MRGAIGALGAYRVTTAGDGAQGLAALAAASSPIGFIVLDLNMPGLDGLTFLRGAANLGFGGGVVISSGEAEAVLRSARALGELLGVRIVGALKKPLTAEALAPLLVRPSERFVPPGSSRIAPAGRLEDLALVPFYQAQHDARDGSVRGLEALVRARSPDGRVHGPGKLFGLVQGHAELVSVTLTIAEKVLTDLKAWRERGLHCRTSINVDAGVMEEPAVWPAIAAMVKDRGIEPALVCLELTETALPADMSRPVEVLTRIRIAGFGVSLDDFGTGGSNFELLRLCPFTEVKVVGSVMRAAMAEPVSLRFLEAVVAMAGELGLEVVGEGVETAAQLDLARQCGVPVIQGFLFSRPEPFDEIAARLADARAPSMRLAG